MTASEFQDHCSDVADDYDCDLDAAALRSIRKEIGTVSLTVEDDS